MLPTAFLLVWGCLTVGAETMVPIEVTCVDDEATGYATFQSHNQKVIDNRHGLFLSFIRSRNEPYTAQQWRLVRSTDGGTTFSVIHEETHATNPPVLETDDQGNVYLVRVDFQDGNAYLYRFLADRDFRDPTITTIPGAAAGKYTMRYDPGRKQLYFFAHNNTFHVVGLDGQVRSSTRLLQAGKNAVLQYPLLDLDPEGTLHAAWTTQKHGVYLYWDIHHMLSRDGGQTWQNLDGASLTPPVVADDTGPALRLTLDDEFEHHTWLSSFRVKRGKLHFVYQAQTEPPREHYVRYEVATGRREKDQQPRFGGETLSLAGLDGFLITRTDQPESPLYCVKQDAGRIACLISRDNGETWHDYARSEETYLPYAISGCREVTADGHIVGFFTERKPVAQPQMSDARVLFFRIRAE